MRFGAKTAEEIVREAVLELIYTAHDMVAVRPRDGPSGRPRRNLATVPLGRLTAASNLRAKLDALYFHLYGVTDRDDIRYVYSTFPNC